MTLVEKLFCCCGPLVPVRRLSPCCCIFRATWCTLASYLKAVRCCCGASSSLGPRRVELILNRMGQAAWSGHVRSPTVVVVGLDGAGKTSLCRCLRGKPFRPDEPPSGLQWASDIVYLTGRRAIHLQEISGDERARCLWKHWINDYTSALVVVVDAARGGEERWDEVRTIVRGALDGTLPVPPTAPLMVFASKLDDLEDERAQVCADSALS